MESLFPNTPPAGPATPPIGPTPRAAVALIIDPTIKTNPPVATIEKFDATGATIKIGCPGGMVTIDAATIGGAYFKPDTHEKTGRMINVGLVELFSPERRTELGISVPEKFHISRESGNPRLTFGVNGTNETPFVSKRSVLAEALGKLMPIIGGSLTAEPTELDATAPDALANVSAPKKAAPAPAPTPTPAAAGLKLAKPAGTQAAAANSPAPSPTVSAAPPPEPTTAVAPKPVAEVTAKGTQKIPTVSPGEVRIFVPVATPTPMTPDTLKLENGQVFKSSSETERVVILSGDQKTVYMLRKGKGETDWQFQGETKDVEDLRTQFADLMRNGGSLLPDRIVGAELLKLRAKCV